jgi:hypothetical protein
MLEREQLARKDLVKLLDRTIDTGTLEIAYAECLKIFVKLGGDDDVARSSDFIAAIRVRLTGLIRSRKNKKQKGR